MTRNAGLLLIARVISAFTTVAVLAVVARIRGPEDLGVVALGLTIGLALAVFSEAGLTALLIREVARRPTEAGSLLSAVLLTRAVALPVVVFIVALLLSISFPQRAPELLIVALGPAIQQVGELARGVFVARDRISVASIHSIVENVGWLATIVVGLTSGASLGAAFALAVGVLLLIDGGAFVLLHVFAKVRPERPSIGTVRDLLGRGIPFAAFATLSFVASRSDTLLVALLLPNGVATAGAYFAAARLVGAGDYLPESVSRALLPDLSRRYLEDVEGVARLLGPPARQLLAFGIVVPFGFILTGAWLMGAVYGADLSAYGWVLLVLGAVLPFRYMSVFFGSALAATDAAAKRTIFLVAAVAVSTALQILFIPRLGILGAIVGVYAVWLPMAILSVGDIQSRFGQIFRLSDALIPLAIAGSAFLVGAVVLQSGAVQAEPLSGVCYAAIALGGIITYRSLPRLAGSSSGSRRLPEDLGRG
jgi:O-antigen/teichoic acid export membrane protein